MPLHHSKISAVYKKSIGSKIRSLVKCSYGCKNKQVTSEAIFQDGCFQACDFEKLWKKKI